MTSVFIDWPDGGNDAARRIAEGIRPRREEFIKDLHDSTIREVPELATDSGRRILLYASIAENTLVLIDALNSLEDPSTITPPPGAIAYARELARHDVSLAALLRAYRIGQAKFTTLCLDSAHHIDGIDDITALRIVIAKVAAFIDHISEEVTQHYEAERDRHISTRSGLTQHLIQCLLDGDAADGENAAAALGYDLAGPHLAIDIASRQPQNRADDEAAAAHRLLTSQLAQHATLDTPTSPTSVCMWIAPAEDTARITERIHTILSRSRLPVQAAIGLAGIGLQGFRHTYRQAQRIRTLCRTADPAPPLVVSFSDIAPVAMLDDDFDELRAFVHETLGSLATDTNRLAELRETLRVYLKHHKSPASTSAHMILHRNTIRYRIQQVHAEYPHLLDTADPYLIASALEICRWYGKAVLDDRPPPHRRSPHNDTTRRTAG